MELNKGKLIIEFNGLPGSGKSTICDAIVKNYADKLDIAQKFNYYSSGSRGKIKSMLNMIHYGGLKALFGVLRYIASYGKLKECGIKYFLNCYIFFASYNRFLKTEKSRYLFVDQGFVQSLISIIYLDEVVVNKEMKRLVSMMFESFDILVVNCMSDGEICTERINGRNQEGRFDMLDKDELTVFLEKQRKTFSVVRDYLKTQKVNMLDLDMTASVDENCKILYNYVKD